MREWPAYVDLKTKIEDFYESIPLIEMLSNPSMQPRHWKAIETLTQWQFKVDDDDFLLKNVMKAPLLQFKEDIEVYSV